MVIRSEINAGEGSFCAGFMGFSQGVVVVKGGAERVSSALFHGPGLTIVVNAVDGANRVAEAALAPSFFSSRGGNGGYLCAVRPVGNRKLAWHPHRLHSRIGANLNSKAHLFQRA